MSLFVKYNENKTKDSVSNSVLNRNTLFNDVGLEQSSPSQDVSLGRVESSLFKRRQEEDEERIKDFLKTPGGRSHIDKEIRLARSNPDFGPTSGQRLLDTNPSRTILPSRVSSTAGIAGSGIFNSKFGLIGSIGERQGYAKYDLRRKNNETDSKLVFLQQKFHPLQPSESGFGETRLGRFLTGISSALSTANSFLTRGVPPKDILYEYSGGPGSDNGIGLTTIYRHQPLIDDNFYVIKNNLGINKRNLNNFELNKFWNHNVGKDIGNNIADSRFVENRTFSIGRFGLNTSPRNYREKFKSEFISPFNPSNRFITSGLPETNEYKEGKFNKSPISDYYETKDIRLYNGLKQEGTKSLPNFKSITIGSLNSEYEPTPSQNEPSFNGNFYKDLIDFKLEIIDLDSPNKSYYLYFKPFIESFTDDYTPTYETLSYPGNPSGKIFKYQNFNRTLSMSFKIALFSKSEHENIYKKLNRLVSTTLPTIQNGTIRSTITKLTVGNWCKRLPGVVTGINFSNLFENPWDIDEETPQVINVNLNYQYSSTYGDDVVVSSSGSLYNSFSIGVTNAAQ